MGCRSLHVEETESVNQAPRKNEPRSAEGQRVELAFSRANCNASLSPSFLVQQVATQKPL